MDARRALADIQAGKELNDEFAGMSAHDVEQHISQMLAAAASVHSEVTKSESIKVSPSLRSTIVPMADFASQPDYDVVQDHAQETTSAATIAEHIDQHKCQGLDPHMHMPTPSPVVLATINAQTLAAKVLHHGLFKFFFRRVESCYSTACCSCGCIDPEFACWAKSKALAVTP